jgi:AraC-like DNA-binding protein
VANGDLRFAAQLLKHTGLRLAEIAARVGYKSEFAFQLRLRTRSRTFTGAVSESGELDRLRRE